MTTPPLRSLVVPLAVAAALMLPRPALAHCDTLDGPVVTAARLALQRGDIQPVLKWVKADVEAELRAAFARTLSVRAGGGEARDLADTYFFETVVRLHRAGEGAPYTGLKPAGAVEKPIAAADQALATGSVDPFSRLLAEHLASGVRERFARVNEAKGRAEESPEAGRRYVAAYVDYVHYVESVVKAIHASAGAHEHAAADAHR